MFICTFRLVDAGSRSAGRPVRKPLSQIDRTSDILDGYNLPANIESMPRRVYRGSLDR
jgi:hypothetical protein